MKLVKPTRLGALHKTYRFTRRNWFAVSPLCFFRLDAAAEVLPDYLQWPRVMKALGGGQVLDMAMPKPRAEVLLAGSAYAPQGRPVTRMEVGFTVGDLAKTITVIGDRHWRVGPLASYVATEPAPFVEMPLGWDRAFGGAGFSANPSGQGHVARLDMLAPKNACVPLANLEYPDQAVTRISQRPEPAGFGPLDLTLPARREKAGTYDQAWLANDHPGYPRDIDWTFFNCAPADQQRDGFFTGGEPFAIGGMHPAQPLLQGRLPAVRARAFVRRPEAATPFTEIETRLDTVWFFPDQELGVLIFRGRTEVEDSDGLDVDCLMLAYENLADAPRSLDHYQEVMTLRTDPATAQAHVFNESQLSPQKTAQQLRQEQEEQAAAEREALANKQRLIDQAVTEVFAKSGMAVPKDFVIPKAEPDPLGVIPPAAQARGDFDLSGILAKAKAAADQAKADGEARLKKLKEQQQQLAAQVGPQAPEPPAAQLARQQETSRAKALGIPTGPDVAEAVKLAGNRIDAAKGAEIEQGLVAAQALRRRARQVAPQPTAPAEELLPECRRALGDLVRELLSKGESLACRDLAGAELAGVDFSGLDLHEIMLEQADVSGCSFRNANLTGAVFTGARLDGADFAGANLSQANFSSTSGEAADFSACDLSHAFFINARLYRCRFPGTRFANTTVMQARLDGADFSDCEFAETMFVETRIRESDWQRSQLQKCMLINTDVGRATFTESRLHRCALLNIQAEETDFSRAQMQTVQAGGNSSFRCAMLRELDARECGFRKADFTDSCLTGAVVAKTDLGETRLTRAELAGACLYRSILMSADLGQANLRGTDCFEALLRKADFTGANLKKANLYNADLSETVFTDSCLDGANLLNPGASHAA